MSLAISNMVTCSFPNTAASLSSRKVKISIQTIFQINAAALSATSANPAPSRSTQRGQPQHPVYTTQAPCPRSVNVLQPLKPLCGDSSAAVHRAARDNQRQRSAAQNHGTFSSFLFFDHTGCHSVYDAIDVIVCSGDVASTLLQSSQLYRRPIHAENKPA